MTQDEILSEIKIFKSYLQLCDNLEKDIDELVGKLSPPYYIRDTFEIRKVIKNKLDDLRLELAEERGE